MRKSKRNINCTNETSSILSQVPDDGIVGVVVVVTGVLFIVILDSVAVGPVVVVSGTVDDVGCGDSVGVVIGVESITGSVRTYVTYILCKCFVSFEKRLFVFRKLHRMIFIFPLKYQTCTNFCLFTIINLKADNRT